MTNTTNPTDAPLTHDEAIDAICGCAATVTVLSYQEAIEAYLDLRGIDILAIQATEARAQGLVDALTASALRFREYEASHAAKGNLDGDAKARRNCEMAEQCEQALATWRRT